jgi:[protein-PII] uridylyltransferase
MQELVKKIEADAAARLPLPPGRQATEELTRYKGFLKLETHRLKMAHRAGAGGLQICHARAAVLDEMLRHLWNAAKATLSEQAQREFPALALVAIGGYGRAELNPHSDIDFMFLHDRQVAVRKPLPHLSKLIDGLLYPLWDIGLKVGHSVRTIDDCIKVANTDMQSKTSLIESRVVAGDADLFEKFEKALLSKCVQKHEQEYIAMRVADQNARRSKFGNSACMQEPNIKNGCGGLRDYQNLLWMAFFKYRTRSLKELQAHEMISEAERKQLEAAYDFLLRVRTEMHYHVDRGVDVLSKSLQPSIAHNLGYGERSPSQRIERFMRHLYTHSRNIFRITHTVEQRLALLPKPRKLSFRSFLPGGRARSMEPVDGFKIVDGEIQAASPRVFRDQPRRLMRLFLYAQQRGLEFHPDLAQMVRNQLGLVDRAFLTDEHVRETFLTILGQRGSVSRILRAMHDMDLLGKYIPEFGKLTCRVQHEFYHQYTADEHTLMCLQQLDKVWDAKEPPYNEYLPIFQKIERPFLLYLALLLHDVGKPDGHGNHAQVSAEMALRVAKRLRLDGSATHTLCLVIEQHLLMASTSQRRDLDDPAVIRRFAKQIQNTEALSLLTLHTFIDSQATSDKLWNGFKDSLLWSLHNKASSLMTGGTEFVRAEEKQRELLSEQVERMIPEGVTSEELRAHFASLPPRYFQIQSAREVVDDLVVSHRFMSLQTSDQDNPLTPVVDWHDQRDRGCNAVKICTWDRAGLFWKIAGSFSAAGLNILSAQIFTRADGIVLDTFDVQDARSGNLAGAPERERFGQVINKALTGEPLDLHALIHKQKITRPIYQAYSGERIATNIRFDNDASDTRTVIEIETEDRVGLLYSISEQLSELALDISGAKISTERGAAIDSFYVREFDGTKVVAQERQRAIQARLRSVITELERR